MIGTTQTHDDQSVRDLSRTECLDLLQRSHLGRLAHAESVGVFPVVLPMTYVMHDGALFLRSGPGLTSSAAVMGTYVTFEVDQTDDLGNVGWSILVRGTTSAVPHATGLVGVEGRLLQPHDPVSRHRLLKVDVESVNGWRTCTETTPDVGSSVVG